MTEQRPGYRTDQPFTVDDLTSQEYSTLARLIKGDPTAAFSRDGSELGGDAIAGLVMLRDRRHRADATLGTYQARTMRDLQCELGFLRDPALAHELPDESPDDLEPAVVTLSGESLVDRATGDAEDVAGEGTDPTAPPVSQPSP